MFKDVTIMQEDNNIKNLRSPGYYQMTSGIKIKGILKLKFLRFCSFHSNIFLKHLIPLNRLLKDIKFLVIFDAILVGRYI